MKKLLQAILAICLFMPTAFSQKGEYTRPAAIGISFFLNDFKTPALIRSTSLSKVLADKSFAGLGDMSPGIAVTYFKGLNDHVDFAGGIGGSFVNYPMPGKSFSGDAFLLEVNAQVNLKMTTEQYWVQPYIIAGVSGHKYRSYYGATLPLGLGMKVNFFDEAHLFINTTYKVPVVTETSNYHFQHSIGIAGTIGKKKLKN